MSSVAGMIVGCVGYCGGDSITVTAPGNATVRMKWIWLDCIDLTFACLTSEEVVKWPERLVSARRQDAERTSHSGLIVPGNQAGESTRPHG